MGSFSLTCSSWGTLFPFSDPGLAGGLGASSRGHLSRVRTNAGLGSERKVGPGRADPRTHRPSRTPTPLDMLTVLGTQMLPGLRPSCTGRMGWPCWLRCLELCNIVTLCSWGQLYLQSHRHSIHTINHTLTCRFLASYFGYLNNFREAALRGMLTCCWCLEEDQHTVCDSCNEHIVHQSSRLCPAHFPAANCLGIQVLL